MPRLKVSLKSIWTGPKQNKDFTPQELQVLFCKFLMKHIVTCQICAEGVLFRCSHHRIFIARLQNWFLQREASLPLWKSNSPILMYVNLLYYREENFFSYQTNYDLVESCWSKPWFPSLVRQFLCLSFRDQRCAFSTVIKRCFKKSSAILYSFFALVSL